MKIIKTFNSILACGLLLMSFGLAFGQTTDERKLELVVQSGQSHVNSIVFSSDGKIFATHAISVIKLWDTQTGEELRTLLTSSNRLMKFSPNGKILACLGKTNEIEIWDTESGTKIKSLEGNQKQVTVLEFSSDGKILFSSNGDNISAWSIFSGEELKKYPQKSDMEIFHIFIFDKRIVALRRNFKSTIVRNEQKIQEDIPKLLNNQEVFVELFDVENGEILKVLEGINIIEFEELPFVSSFAFADISSNGKIITYGCGVNCIKIESLESGIELGRVNNFTGYLSNLKLNFNGTKIVAGIINNSGTEINYKLFDVKTGKELHNIGNQKFPSISWLDSDAMFTPFINPINNEIAFGKADGTINLWNSDTFQSILTIPYVGRKADSIAFNPNGDMLAITTNYFIKETQVSFWSLRGNIRPKNFISDVYIQWAGFAPDGKFLIYHDPSNGVIKSFDTQTGEESKLDKQYIQDYSLRYSLLSSDGKTATMIENGKNKKTGMYEISLVDTKTGKTLKKFDWNNQSVIVNPDGTLLASLEKDGIGFWNIDSGKKLRTLVETSDSVFMLAFSPDGNIFASGDAEDGRIVNLWDVKSGRKLAQLINIDDDNWIITTPDGRFDASEGALKLMHYSYGLEVINLDQLKEAYYEPGLLQKLLGYSKEPLRPIVPLKDVKLYPEVVEQTVAPDSTKLTIKLKNRGGGIGAVQVFVSNEFGTKLAVEDARDARLKQNPNVPEATLTVDLQGTGYLTGKPNRVTVVTSNYLKEIGKGNIQSRGTEIVWLAGGKEEEYKLPTLYAIVGGVSDYAGDNLKLRFAAKDAEDFSNALSLGAKKLFCDKTKPNCIDKVNITTLSTSGNAGTILPTKENFVKAFREVAAKAKPEDIVVIYLAGHGVSFGVGTDSYFYLTQEARTTSREDLAKVLTTSAISSDELRDWLTPDTTNPNDIFVKAMKQVVILDTCASGNAAGQLALTAKRDLSGDQIRAVEFLKDKTGTFVLMASTADAPSYEASQFGQGLLTYSLLQAMKGAALDKGEYVDVQQLFSYAQKEVPQLASNIGGVQRPIVSAPLGKTFVIGQMTDTEKRNLNLPAPKPLLLRPLLTNPETGDDDLNLIPQLRKMLDAESSYEVMRRSGKGDPTLIYIDDDTFPGAVRVTGTYTVEGKTVRVKAFLRQDGKTIATLPEIVGVKDEISGKMLIEIRKQIGGF